MTFLPPQLNSLPTPFSQSAGNNLTHPSPPLPPLSCIFFLPESEVYQRLSPPIPEITPRTGEPPMPFRCEVIVRPAVSSTASLDNSSSCNNSITANNDNNSNNMGNNKKRSKPPVTHFLRGWAQARATTSTARETSRGGISGGGGGRVSLRQQVAPRSATFGPGYAYRSGSAPPPPLPSGVLGALGQVTRGGKEHLEKLVTQDVTYVGETLRVGRSRSKTGELFVYERCDWPENWQ